MPEMGLLDEPISPVSREETVTNRKPNSTMSTAAARATARWIPIRTARPSTSRRRTADRTPERPKCRPATATSRKGRFASKGRGRCGALAARPAVGRRPQVAQPGANRATDQRQGPEEADDSAGGHGSGADVEHVEAAQLAGIHVADQHRGRGQRLVKPRAEVHDGRAKHQPGQHAAGHHERGDPRADDVAHAQQGGV